MRRYSTHRWWTAVRVVIFRYEVSLVRHSCSCHYGTGSHSPDIITVKQELWELRQWFAIGGYFSLKLCKVLCRPHHRKAFSGLAVNFVRCSIVQEPASHLLYAVI